MSRRFVSRGLTLIEVLLAVTLLAALTAISVGIIRDAGFASDRLDKAIKIDEAARLIDDIAAVHTNELYGLQPGQSWRPPFELIAGYDHVRFDRVSCDDCPDGFGRFRVTVDAVSLARFHKVQPAAEGLP